MTIQTTSSKAGPFIGNGSTTTFACNFQIDKPDDLQVVYTNALAQDTTLDLSQYMATGFGDPAGVTVTYPISGPPIGANEKLTLLRLVDYDQQTSITNQGGFYPTVIEKALDRIVMQCQQLAEKVGRAITVGVSSTEDPNAAFQSIAINAAIAQQAAAEASGSADSAADSAAAAGASAASIETPIPVVSGGTGAETAAEARANLGINEFESFTIVVSPDISAPIVGTGRRKIRMPYAFTLTEVRASLSAAQSSGGIVTVDINEDGNSILSTKLTIDNTEATSTTATTPPVISDVDLANDAEISIDVDQAGDGTARGLKVMLIGRQP